MNNKKRAAVVRSVVIISILVLSVLSGLFFQFLQSFSRKAIGQHLASQFRIHGLNRDIDRCQMELDDTIDIFITHIGQSDVVTL